MKLFIIYSVFLLIMLNVYSETFTEIFNNDLKGFVLGLLVLIVFVVVCYFSFISKEK